MHGKDMVAIVPGDKQRYEKTLASARDVQISHIRSNIKITLQNKKWNENKQNTGRNKLNGICST